MTLATTSLTGNTVAPARYGSSRVLTLVLLAAFLAVRPNLLGERFALYGLIVCGLALVVVVLYEWRRARVSDASAIVIAAFVGGSAWDTFRAADYSYETGPYVQGFATGLVILVTFGVVFGNPTPTRNFGRALLWLIAIASVSSGVTFVMAATVGTIPIGVISLGNLNSQVLFPITPTLSHLSFLGIPLDRSIGIGREPGWWGMYAAYAWAIWPVLMPRTRLSSIGRWTTVLGVITSASTAGFAIFVVALALDVIFRPRPHESAFRVQVRWLVGFAFLAASLWIAFNTPQLGLNAKSSVNNVSLTGRNLVTADGWQALTNFSLGEPSVNYAPNVNLIAGSSVGGWPFFVLALCALLLPLAFTRNRMLAMTPIAVITLTMLFAQPISGSHAVYVLVMLACAASSWNGHASDPVPKKAQSA